MTTVLIPAYEPDQRLLQLIADLKAVCRCRIVVVDDGSGEAYGELFHSAREAGCIVLTHGKNLGKGRALKTGFTFLKEAGETGGIVCADSDGQHLPSDIVRIAAAVDEHPEHIVLGCRHFTGRVPLRSRFGNLATRLVYTLTTGHAVTDTQTGLRGFSSAMLDWMCSIPGDRFEYEMNMLLQARGDGYPIHEVPIDTVYLEKNKSSHFRPIADSARIYAPILKFCSSSVLSAGLDFLLLFALQMVTGSLLVAVVGSRLCSAIFNYAMNRRYVFVKRDAPRLIESAPKYFALVVLILVLNYGLMVLFHEILGIPLFIAKLLTEGFLFVFSYWCQRKFVFHSRARSGGRPPKAHFKRYKKV
ncbi:bifunctional glycosyltransferase family 2/GtrA family protein [Paenibacillus sp. XY044]|uniref:bifunctional glycosyltransferase family 2/GtrA family protein n=1 Tax=Paenibacillus sp. XY044 TaxID=2026089 RepID=UPI000B980BA3|nr:bifunctional glycosyltransferase family 2/GtrA family protein [Paenibacillus sp. XY044]OZB92735.1 glycosyl transferase family 2 [Paenibacillus sp. XY044]